MTFLYYNWIKPILLCFSFSIFPLKNNYNHILWLSSQCSPKHMSEILKVSSFFFFFKWMCTKPSVLLFTSSPGHCVPTAALCLGNVALLRRVLRRAEGGRCLPHRGGPLPHHDQLRQSLALLLPWRWGRRGRGRQWEGTRKQSNRERCWETCRWRMTVCVFLSFQHQHHHRADFYFFFLI